ncbi:MAG: ferrous iron transport protein A [Gammaproteobacteria bacterium]|nr:ferrous iron transport protein A [Gammaproteobacteria bacterium]
MDRSLADLKPGDRARVIRFNDMGPLSQRIMTLGLLEGSEVQVIRRAPTGDPMEIRVMDYALSLRRDEASTIQVELLS